jgi:hypothetical protein
MVQSSLAFARPVFSDVVLRKFETAVVDYVVGGGVYLRAAGGLRFKRFLASRTDGYEPPSTRTILRRIAELFRIALPITSGFFGNLDVAISLTLDGWSNRNLNGFYVVTAHWVDVSSMSTKSVLLTIIVVASGTGVGAHVGVALFEHLKRMGRDVLTRVLNVTSENGSDAIAAVKRLFQLINYFVGYEQTRPSNQVRCANNSVQLGVLLVMKHIKTTNEELRQALIKIRRSKVMRQEYRIVSASTGLASKEQTHADSPTRWKSTHEIVRCMCKHRPYHA